MVAAATVLSFVAMPASGHRLDEYLQATTLDLGKDRIALEIRLTPGVEVCPTVLAEIDTNGDGVISPAEQRAYVMRVLRDVSLTIDSKPIPLRPISWTFATIEQMKDGLGDIVLKLDAQVPAGARTRQLVFQNHHHSTIAAYLVNCLSPVGQDIHVLAQERNYDQSYYRLEYVQERLLPRALPAAWWSTSRLWLAVNATVAFGWLAITVRRRRGRIPPLRQG